MEKIQKAVERIMRAASPAGEIHRQLLSEISATKSVDDLMEISARLGLAKHGEDNGETCCRLLREGDSEGAEIYQAIEDRWWQLEE